MLRQGASLSPSTVHRLALVNSVMPLNGWWYCPWAGDVKVRLIATVNKLSSLIEAGTNQTDPC